MEDKSLVPMDQVYQTPNDVVAMASEKAKALQGVVKQRKNPLIIGGKQYLQFEDWQTLGRFDGVTAGVDWTQALEGCATEGFLAHASCWQNGVIISSAEGQCDRTEAKWKDKPMFQLRSMAQTRACAKCLRNVLAWVAVLAGYEATPAEEMVVEEKPTYKPKAKAIPQKTEIKSLEIHGGEKVNTFVDACVAAGFDIHNNPLAITEWLVQRFSVKRFSDLIEEKQDLAIAMMLDKDSAKE